MSSGMKLVDQIKQCRTPQEALLLLAAAIDDLNAKPEVPAVGLWDAMLTWSGDQPTIDDLPSSKPTDNRAVIQDGDVIVKPVSLERQLARNDFAASARLSEYYGPSLSEADFLATYAKGGPRWLYYINRECVMQMPKDLRRELVADVLLDSPSEAAEIGADILKHDESVPESTGIEFSKRDLGPVAL